MSFVLTTQYAVAIDNQDGARAKLGKGRDYARWIELSYKSAVFRLELQMEPQPEDTPEPLERGAILIDAKRIQGWLMLGGLNDFEFNTEIVNKSIEAAIILLCNNPVKVNQHFVENFDYVQSLGKPKLNFKIIPNTQVKSLPATRI